jgi:hypothetical protein
MRGFDSKFEKTFGDTNCPGAPDDTKWPSVSVAKQYLVIRMGGANWAPIKATQSSRSPSGEKMPLPMKTNVWDFVDSLMLLRRSVGRR